MGAIGPHVMAQAKQTRKTAAETTDNPSINKIALRCYNCGDSEISAYDPFSTGLGGSFEPVGHKKVKCEECGKSGSMDIDRFGRVRSVTGIEVVRIDE